MKNNIIKSCIAAGLLVCAVLLQNINSAVSLFIFIASYLTVGVKPVISAVKSISKGSFFGEDTLMVTASVGAFIMHEYSEAVAVMLFYSIGSIFENSAVTKSRNSVTELINLQPDRANLIKDGNITTADVSDVQTGDITVIFTGEKIPLDGTVIEGCGYIDTSALTGESVPKAVTVGDEVVSGCINLNSTLKIKVSKTYENSTASKIVELIEDSAVKKSKSEKFITKFAKYYTPAVLICAVLITVIPLILSFIIPSFDFEIKNRIYTSLEFLVVSCPCALVISIPITFFGSIGTAARKGILIKGSNYLETVADVKNAVFDKTGTLTKGIFKVTAVNPENCDKDTLLYYATYAECQSIHPVAKAISAFYGGDIDSSRIKKYEEFAGLGVIAEFDGKTVIAGNLKLMEKYGIDCKKCGNGTAVYVAVDGKYSGNIVISDEIKTDSLELMSSLKKMGISTYMLTGDNETTAGRISKELDIDSYSANLMPSDKTAELEKIMRNNGKTLYAGDGINDAPVIALADIGVAMGALGSDAAIEAADTVIMNDDISKIAELIKIGRYTRKIAKQNIVFALAVKILILILCTLGIANMWLAVFGDVGVLIICVINSLRTIKK